MLCHRITSELMHRPDGECVRMELALSGGIQILDFSPRDVFLFNCYTSVNAIGIMVSSHFWYTPISSTRIWSTSYICSYGEGPGVLLPLLTTDNLEEGTESGAPENVPGRSRIIITESVDSVCRDGMKMPYVQYKQKPGKLCHKHSHKLSKVPDLHHGVFCIQPDPQSC